MHWMHNYIPHETTDSMGMGKKCDWYEMYIGGILNDFIIVPKRDVPYFYIANTRSAMTGGRTTYEETARSSGIMSVSTRV